jgi:hypothetical protein
MNGAFSVSHVLWKSLYEDVKQRLCDVGLVFVLWAITHNATLEKRLSLAEGLREDEKWVGRFGGLSRKFQEK